jgi:translation initiation factor eIF-2B subunit alpha
MKEEATKQMFQELIKKQPDLSLAVIAISVLTQVIKESNANTMMELNDELNNAVKTLRKVALTWKDPLYFRGSSISLTSGCELFMRFVTRQFLETQEFAACKKKLVERGRYITQLSSQSRQKVAKLFEPFFRDNMVVLVVGFSRVVYAALVHAAKHNKRVSVITPEMRPDAEGYKMAKELQAVGIPVKLIIDSAVGHVMSKVDFVLSGAEGVVENGGVINKIGTYQIAVLAKTQKKPFYVAAESFKFVRQYPLTQDDIENIEYINKPQFTPVNNETLPENIEILNPTSDFTPPSNITLLFTDLGIMTPSGISDELIKLYS